MNRASLNHLIGRNNLVGCEIGTLHGENANDILSNLDVERIYLVDPYPSKSGEDAAHALLSPFENKIRWLRKRSQDVTFDDIPKCSLDFVYIDGDHSYEAVRDDIKTFLPMMKVGCNALFAGHDYGKARNGDRHYYVETGVKQAVLEFCKEHGYGEPFHELTGGREDWWVFLR